MLRSSSHVKEKKNSLDGSRELYKKPKDAMPYLKHAGQISEGRKEKKMYYIYIHTHTYIYGI